MIIKEFNKSNLPSFRDQFQKAIASLEKETGVKIDLGNISFNNTQFTTKLTVTAVGASGDTDKIKFEADAKRMYGIKPEDYGRKFSSHTGTHKLVGLKPTSYKYPLIGEDVKTGKRFKFPQSILGDNIMIEKSKAS